MPHNYSDHDLRWDATKLRLHSGRVITSIEPDGTWPGMWRVRLPDGSLTDMVNLTRAKDAGLTIALRFLSPEMQATGTEGHRVPPRAVRLPSQGLAPRRGSASSGVEV
jgi:hypothetical protein